MQTRRSNKTKRFLDVVLVDSDDEDGWQSPVSNEPGDENFAAGDALGAELGAGADAGGEPEDDDDEDEEFDSDVDDENVGEARRRQTAGTTSAPLRTGKRRRDYHELPVYPLESRILTRVYTGELKRQARNTALRDVMYGPQYECAKLIWDLRDRWLDHPVLPAAVPRKDPMGVLPSPWVPPHFEASQEAAACEWYRNYRADASAVQRSHAMVSKTGQKLIPEAEGDVITLLGPLDGLEEYRLKQGDSIALSSFNLPVDAPGSLGEPPTGWIFDVGGLVLAMDWAPIARGGEQVLALAVIPHSDQAARREGDGDPLQEESSAGSIQFWGFSGEEGTQERLPRPSRRLPKFLAAKCFDWGRPKRLQFCPVPLDGAGICAMLAVLCGDGRARVIEVETLDHSADATQFEWVESPVATLGITDDYNIQATCLTWTGTNRVALGHSDGTVTLWSIHPCQLLQRHAVHTSFVLDISSGYPSQPYLVASVPVGGSPALTDLSQPTSESTFIPSPAIAFQPGLLSWNDHMQGWIGTYPLPGPGATALAFLHARYFVQPRTMTILPSAPMSLSAAGPHPFLLVGCADGSLWSFNALTRLFRLKDEQTVKLKVLEHEFRRPDAFELPDVDGLGPPLRGATRVVQGFRPVVNEDPRVERLREHMRRKKAQKGKTKSGKRRGRPPKNPPGPDAGGGVDGDAGDAAAGDPWVGDPRFVIHEPLTRVAAVAWNPNVDFGCWAAVAFGSGLVRVMDLGVE